MGSCGPPRDAQDGAPDGDHDRFAALIDQTEAPLRATRAGTLLSDTTAVLSPAATGLQHVAPSAAATRTRPTVCRTHKNCKRGCPKPCPKDRKKHASACPERKDGGLVPARPKTKKSTNPVPIPSPFIPYLHEHKAQQEEMRAAAGDEWQEYEALFTRPDGRPLDPRADWEEFKDLLAEAEALQHPHPNP